MKTNYKIFKIEKNISFKNMLEKRLEMTCDLLPGN